MAAIGQLAAGIAHELRNPLAIVMNALYDLRQVLGAAPAEVLEDLHIAEEEISRAQAIIKNLLEFSRESGAEMERVDVNDLLTRTVQLMQKYLQNAGVRVTADLGDDAALRRQRERDAPDPAQPDHQRGAGHAQRRRALPAHRPLGNGDRVPSRGSRHGVGIAAVHLRDIFNPFYTTKAPGQGTGLGLSVVHSILQRYRGDIRVDERGRRRYDVQHRAALPLSRRRGARRRRRPDVATPARILLVEDELNMARTLAKNLERAGYEVEHAPHGEAALARLGSVNFDVVLTDLKMPVMDGMDLLRAMHERDIAAAAVVLTGYGTIESAVEAMKLGAADYLIKDARPQEILLTLDRVLRVAR